MGEHINPLPDNEEDRLKALQSYTVLDTLPESEYDAITALASSITGSPIALISLIDKNRQWFKSKVGLAVNETPRDISFCQYAIMKNEIFEVEDATKNKTFKDNPLVTGDPKIRFYAGAPLTDADGYNLGTLCVIDKVPKVLTTQQKESLSLLAKFIVNILLLKKRNSQFLVVENENKKITQHLIEAQSIAKIGSWEFNTENLDLYWAEEHYKIFELEHILPEKLYQAYRDRIHPDDLIILDQQVNAVLEKGELLNYHHRAVFSDGRIKHVLGLGTPVKNSEGKIIGIRGTVQDITEQVLIAEKEKLLEKELQSFFDLSLDFMCIAGIDGTLKVINNAFAAELGYSKEELIGASYLKLIHPDDREIASKELNKLSDGKSTIDFEIRFITKNGDYLWLSWRVTPELKSENLFAAARNITIQKKRNAELKAALTNFENYKYALDQSSIVAITDYKGTINYVNDNFCKISEYTAEELIGKDHRLLNSGYHTKEFIKELWNTITSGRVWRGEIRNKTKTGKIYWTDSTIVPLLDDNGKISQYVAVRSDITQKKEFESSLADTLAYLSAILNSTEYSIIATELDGTIQHFNEGAEKMLGYKKEEVIGKVTPAFIHVMDEVIERAKILTDELGETVEPGFNTFIVKAKKTGTADLNEWTYVRKDESKFPVSLSVTCIKNNEGNITGYLGIAKDITKEKEQEQELIKAKEEAEHYAKVKQDFLANMSHEIRTPMNAILGFSRLLLEKSYDEEQKDYLQTITYSAENLLVIINDILDIAKMESGKLNIEEIPFEINEIVNKSISVVKHNIGNKPLTIKATIDAAIPDKLIGDSNRLGQILLNLLSNAIKFTHKGEISITVTLNNLSTTEADILFSVKDTGVGIPKEHQHLIFQSFVQVDSYNTRKYGGTGLGLSIVKNLVELMGGRINVISEVNIGSNFMFNIIFKRNEKYKNDGAPKIINSSKQKPQLNLEVLLAEDNEVNQKLAGIYLKQVACNYDVAADGLEALKMAFKKKYDIILMDIQMPEMDGITASKKIRERDAVTPIVAMTAHVFEEEKEKCLSAGINGFLAKPFKLDQLIEAIQLNYNAPVTEKTNSYTTNNSIDFSFLKESVGNDERIIKDFIIIFKRMVSEYTAAMDKAIEEENFEIAYQASHKVVSSCKTLGLKALYAIVKKIEKTASERTAFEEIKQHYKTAEELIKEIMPQIDILLKK